MDGAAKSCGECTLCCRLLGVKSIAKAPLAACRHAKPGLGCGIYADRPAECAAFICYWLHQPSLDEAWRPDRAGFLLHVGQDGRQMNVEIDPRRPDAWRQEPYFSALKGWAVGGAKRGMALHVWVGQRCFALDADGAVDLGFQRKRLKDGIGWALKGAAPAAPVRSPAE